VAAEGGRVGVDSTVRADDVVGDERSVTPDTADEVRVAAVLEALTEYVETRDRRAAAALADLAVLVEHRQPQRR
jgi:hypothetical protein